MIAGIASRRTSASAPCSASRFHAQSSTTSVGVNVTFFAAIIAMVSSRQPARGVLDAVGAGLDRQPDVRVGADVNGGSHPPRLGLGHRREKHFVAQPRHRTPLESGFEHQLDDVNALAIELRDRRARGLG